MEEEVEDRDISRVYAVAIDIRTSTSSADPSRSRRLPPAFLLSWPLLSFALADSFFLVAYKMYSILRHPLFRMISGC